MVKHEDKTAVLSLQSSERESLSFRDLCILHIKRIILSQHRIFSLGCYFSPIDLTEER